jgi:serine/threonine-protein kinase
MGTVYLAQLSGPSGFEKWVAIKWIHPHLAKDLRFVTMFLDEARLVAQLSHPNIGQVHDLVADAGTCWIVMEYLYGEPLSAVIARAVRVDGGLPPALAARIVADAARGLHAAHEARGKDGALLGIVHRDVSPHNVHVLHDGSVKLLDFGIAKARGRLASSDPGELKGKFAYMSPEQVRHQELDRRSDVWALGVVLWEALTGKFLFRAANPAATVRRVIDGTIPRPSRIRPGAGIQGALDDIVLAALTRDVNGRTPTAAALADALEGYLHGLPTPTTGATLSSWMIGHFADRRAKRDALLSSVVDQDPSRVLEVIDEPEEGEEDERRALPDETPTSTTLSNRPPAPDDVGRAPTIEAPAPYVPIRWEAHEAAAEPAPPAPPAQADAAPEAPAGAFRAPPSTSTPLAREKPATSMSLLAEPSRAPTYVRTFALSLALLAAIGWLVHQRIERARLFEAAARSEPHREVPLPFEASDAGTAPTAPGAESDSHASPHGAIGWVQVTATPPGEVFEGDDAWGTTPIHRHAAPVGVHTVEVRWHDLRRTYRVTVRAGQTANVRAHMSDRATP